jgi:lipopolysaccharide export system protein LptA
MAHFVRVPVRTGSITLNADRVTYIRETGGSAGDSWCEVYFDAGRSVTVNLSVEALISLTAKR